MPDKPLLAIGDVHGHYDRLEALLRQEGIIGDCPLCDGRGDDGKPTTDWAICPQCHGDGVARINKDVTVVQLGDLGHFGSERTGMYGAAVPGSSSADLMCYQAAVNGWIDIVLWGNHDRAVIDSIHAFGGYIDPPQETIDLIEKLHIEGRLRLTYEAHGFLLSHAGLHAAFKHQKVADRLKERAFSFSSWMNLRDRVDLAKDNGWDEDPIRDNIGVDRCGPATSGGILWRDAGEKLYAGFRQIFGHSKGLKVRRYGNEDAWSYCIDVGDPHNGRLAAIWLPSETIVEVDTTRRM